MHRLEAASILYSIQQASNHDSSSTNKIADLHAEARALVASDKVDAILAPFQQTLMKLADSIQDLDLKIKELGPISRKLLTLNAGSIDLTTWPGLQELANSHQCGYSIFRDNRRVNTTATAFGINNAATGTAVSPIVETLCLHGLIPYTGISISIRRNWVIRYVPLMSNSELAIGMLAAFVESPINISVS